MRYRGIWGVWLTPLKAKKNLWEWRRCPKAHKNYVTSQPWRSCPDRLLKCFKAI